MTAADLITLKISNGALKDARLPVRLKLLAWGDNQSTKGNYRVGGNTLKALSANQRGLGYERVAIDFDHCSVAGTETNKELLKAGQPPLIFGYGRPNVVENDGLYLDDIIWTPLGAQHARNFEDLSPAVKAPDGEVSLVHSVALTPNGSVHGLQFFSATSTKQPHNKMDPKACLTLASLAAILGLPDDADEATIVARLKDCLMGTDGDGELATMSGRLTALENKFTTLSATAPAPGAGTADLTPLVSRVVALEGLLTASAETASRTERDGIIRLFAAEGKAPKKGDGSAFTAAELAALDAGTLRLLHANTPVTVPLSARATTVSTEGGKPKSYKDEKGRVDLAALFNDEATAESK